MKSLDDIIRGKLANLPQEGTPDWQGLRDRLDGEQFDALLRDGLPVSSVGTGLEPEAQWSALEQRLDLDAERTGELFDEILADRLRYAQVQATPEASWTQLSHRMDTLWPLRKKLVRYRAIEIAAAIVLLLSFVPLLRDNPILTNRATQVAEKFHSGQVEGGVASSQASDVWTAAEQHQASLLIPAGQPNQAPDQRAPFDQTPSRVSELFRTPSALVNGAYSAITSWAGGGADNLPTPQAAELADLNKAPAVGREHSAETVGLTNPARIDELSMLVQPALQTGYFTAEALALKDLAAVDANAHLPAIPVPVAKTPKRKWAVGTSFGLQNWNVRTPRDFEFARTAQSRRVGAAQADMAVIRRLNDRLSLGFGVSLTRLSYDPNFPLVVQPDAYVIGPFQLARAESFTGISLNLAQVPVELRYNLLAEDRRFGLHLKAGLAANFALNTEYDLNTTIAEADRIEEFAQEPMSGFGPPSAAPRPIVRNELPSVAKPFVEGVFDTGLSRSNTFMSGRVGVEASYALNQRLDVFSSVDYSHFIPVTDGFGPNSDAFNTLGLTLGTRLSL